MELIFENIRYACIGIPEKCLISIMFEPKYSCYCMRDISFRMEYQQLINFT